ncbi:MAG TPA: DUF4386 domain-containing protein [Pyrinomonadaceae bacterium]|jgi:hypothetical protein
MIQTPIEKSPQFYARLGGALYLIIIALGIFAQVFVRDKIVVSGDAAATAANLTSMESLWRFGIASEFLAVICTILLAMVYFFLLRPVSKELNLLAALFRLTAIIVQTVSLVYLVTALFPLTNAAFTKAFTPEQLYALTGLAIKSHGYGFSVALLFTGCTFLVHGYLIFKSGYLPRALGVMIQIAGLGYISNGFAIILYPAIANMVFLAIILPVFIGETSLSLWLLIKGVNIPKWNERTGIAPGRALP